MVEAGWIGVDLDGTLAHYDGWHGPENIGAPIPAMLARVKAWLAEGQDVRIFTARVSGPLGESAPALVAIEEWSLKHLGRVLPVTHQKDYTMLELWDDRAVQVVPNTGARADRAEEEESPDEKKAAAARFLETYFPGRWSFEHRDQLAERLGELPSRPPLPQVRDLCVACSVNPVDNAAGVDTCQRCLDA